ncbi:hypothetical protein C7W88_12865 [Novosphingobium sp. THN1]|nr:hypothetical protein C7W88_12865 [Novosphingobium sp. THN1]
MPRRDHEADVVTPSLTLTAAFTALRIFLLGILPAGTEVTQGQANRVPMPQGRNFVVMTPMRFEQMAQTVHQVTPPNAPAPALGTDEIARSMALHFQLDVYGPSSGENATVITTLLRDSYGTEAFIATGFSPLYVEDPFQMPLVAGEQQWMQRWTIRLALHGHFVVTVPQSFADTLITELSEVSSW